MRKFKINRKKCLTTILTIIISAMLMTVTSLAEPSVLEPINKAKDLIVDIVTIVGTIVAIYGGVQLGLSFAGNSHDSGQRTQGVFCLVGGLIVAAAPQLISYLVS